MQQSDGASHKVAHYPPDNATVGYGPMVGYISGNYQTKEVWFDGSLLDNARYSSFPFDWGMLNHGCCELAFAVLGEFESRKLTDKLVLLSYYKLFAQQMIASMPKGNFALAIADVKEWLATVKPEGVQ